MPRAARHSPRGPKRKENKMTNTQQRHNSQGDPGDAHSDAVDVPDARRPPVGGLLTPQTLIDAYCQPGMQSGWRTERREHSRFHAGFCGYDGERGYDGGHSWIDALMRSGWRPLCDIGDWPLVAFMLWRARPTDPRFAIVHYCEGDLAIEVFDDKQAAGEALKTLRRQHAA
jgi:hypothetical protein